MKVKLALAMIALATSANAAMAQDATQTGVTVEQGSTISAQQYLNTVADKFGVSVDRLNSMLAKLPPQGEGLSGLEIAVIASKLHLDKSGKDYLKSKVGKGGTGLSGSDVAMMGASLGLDTPQIAALSSQLGLPNPFASTTASGTITPTTVNYTPATANETPTTPASFTEPSSTTPGAVEVYPPGMQVIP